MKDKNYIEQLIIRYYNKELSEQEKEELLNLLEHHSENLDEFRQIKDIDDAIFQSLNKFNFNHNKAYLNFQKTVGKKIYHKTFSNTRIITSWIAAAAAILIIGWFIFIPEKQNVIQTIAKEIQNIQLPDGSEISLNENSKIVYPVKFKKERKVKFSGEGFFKIKPDSEKPFIIEMDNIEVEVKGTSFNILQDTIKGFIKVTVNEGVVQVINRLKNEKVTVNENEMVEYTYKTNQLNKHKNTELNYNSWESGILIFRDAPLEKVIIDLNNYYKVNFKIENPSLKSCKIDTRIDNITFNEVIHMLEIILDVQIKKENNYFIITGEGC